MAADDSLQYLKLDYASHRDALLQRVRTRWPGVWNDFLANSFGRVLVDLSAWSTSLLAYSIHRVAAENLLPTMTLRESAVRLGAFCGYQLRQPSAASVLCEAVLAGGAPANANVTLAKGTAVSVNGQMFELALSYVIAQGATSPESQVLVIATSRTGQNVLQSTLTAVAGASYLDLAEPTVDLNRLISAGQVLKPLGGGATYTIQAVETASSALLPGRIVLDRAWEGAAGAVEAEVLERRVLLIQGQTFNESFVLPTSPEAGSTLRLGRRPAIQGSISVLVGSAVWPTVPSLATEDSDAQVVEVRTLLDGHSAVVFGDNLFGAVPPGEAQVQVTYRVGGGAAGNVALGAISATIMGRKGSSQVPVSLSNSTAAGQGGLDQENLTEARANIPAHVQSNNRGVTGADYELVASRFADPIYGSVRFARAVAGAKNPLLEGNIVQLYAWTAGAAGNLQPLSSALKRGLQLHLQSKAVGTDYVVILDGTSRPAPVALRFKTLPGVDVTAAKTAILAQVTDAVLSRKPGEPVIFSNLLSALDGLPGVDSVNFATPLTDLEPASHAEVFTVPGDDVSYAVPLTLLANSTYAAQSPVAPLQPWALRAFLDGEELLVLPDHLGNRARLVGTGLAGYEVGLAADKPVASSVAAGSFYYATNETKLYRATTTGWITVELGGSWVHLQSGQIILSSKTAASRLTFQLRTAIGYQAERVVDIFVGYSGQTTQAKRREVRQAIRICLAGLPVGGSLFASAQRNSQGAIILGSSRANITDVVLSVAGVTAVHQVALESASSSTNRIDATDAEIFRAGSIQVNGFID